MRKLILLGLVISVLASCEKDDSTVTDDHKNEYFPFETGNYWIYQYFEIDTENNVTETTRTDSVVITGEISINNKQYYILEGTKREYNDELRVINYLRDSSGYIVNSIGDILFAEDNFTDTLFEKVDIYNEDTLYTLTYKMEEQEIPIEVPAGIFNDVLNYKGTVITPERITGVDNPRYTNAYYAKGVGKVSDSYFYLHAPGIIERRLIRYRVANN